MRYKSGTASRNHNILYADDIASISEMQLDIKAIQQTLQAYKLKFNVEKTEWMDNNKKKTVKNRKHRRKLVGSLLGSREDIERRKHVST